MKRLLNFDDVNTMDSTCSGRAASLEARIADLEGDTPTTLAARMSAAESGLSGHSTRITALEDKFGSGKAAALAAVTVTPSGGVVDVLGIQVATGAAITNLVSAFNTLKASHNDLIARSKSWGWMAA